MIPCTNHYFLVGKILICQLKLPWLKPYLSTTVCYYFVSSEDRLTRKTWVQIYFGVRTFRVLAAMLFSSCEIDDGVERRFERRRENVLFSFGPSHLPPRQFRMMKTTLRLCNLACIAHCKQILRLKNSSLNEIQTMTSAIPVQCSTSWAISPTWTWSLCGSIGSPSMINIHWFKVRRILSRGPFLESPENFSGPKSKLSNCNPLALKSWSFYMF